MAKKEDEQSVTKAMTTVVGSNEPTTTNLNERESISSTMITTDMNEKK